jgi:hypothetical protein
VTPEPKTITQCKSCPWRVDCEPDKDIPNGYCVELHASLRRTISEGVESIDNPHMMACHYSKPGEEFACAGWIFNQAGVGNNVGVRLRLMRGDLPVPIVVGKQHETFADTLPRPKDRKHNYRCSRCGRKGHNARSRKCSEREATP